MAGSIEQQTGDKGILPNSIVCLLGPFAVGKSAILQQLGDNFGFDTPKSYTTREKRPTDNSDLTVCVADEEFDSATMLLCTMHPTTGHKMGYKATDFDGEKPVAIVLSHAAFPALQGLVAVRKRFIVPVMVVAEPTDWGIWRKEREALPDYAARLADARSCLNWAIGAGRKELNFVTNRPENNPGFTAANAIITSDYSEPTAAIAVATKMRARAMLMESRAKR